MDNSYKYFYTLVKLEHYTKASEELGITQSALSKSVQELEFKLNVKLIDKKSKAFKLTKAGHIVYDYAISLRKEHKFMLQRLHKDKKKSSLRIVAGTYWLECVLKKIIPKFNDIDIKIYTANHHNISPEDLLKNDDVDLYLGPFENMIKTQSNSFIKEYFYTTYHSFFVSKDHPLFEKAQVHECIFDYPLITLGGLTITSHYNDYNKFDAYIKNWRTMVIETSSLYSSIHLVKNNQYIVLLPYILKNEMMKNGIVPIYESDNLLSFTSGAMYAKSNLNNTDLIMFLEELKKLTYG